MPRIRSIAEVRLELRSRVRQLRKLLAVRKKVDRQIAALKGAVSGPAKRGRKARRQLKVVRRRRRGARGKPLVEYIRQVLAGIVKGMQVMDVVGAVKGAGYKSLSKDFYGIVATALRDKKNFKKLARGRYKLAK